MHPNVISVAQGKGGVGKTSVAASMAGLLARAGYKVLTLDADPQGNLGRDLAYFDQVDERGDGGKSLLGTMHGYQVEPLRDVRKYDNGGRLDCITAGQATEELGQLLAVKEMSRPGSAARSFHDALEPIAKSYDLIIIDCPPGGQLLQTAAFGASQYVLVPTRADDASIDGLLKVDAVFTQVKQSTNPGLHLLGAFLFAVGTQSSRIAADAEKAIAECLGGMDKVLGGPAAPIRIRYAEGAAQDSRRLGLLPHELEEKLPAAQKARFADLKARRSGRHRPDAVERISGSSAGLAADHAALVREVLTRIKAHRESLKVTA